jgi:small subunit ribosomal protein S17
MFKSMNELDKSVKAFAKGGSQPKADQPMAGAKTSGGKKIIEGTVVSDKMEKTVVVALDVLKVHPKYLKRYQVTRKFKAHDPENRFKVGDKVQIVETKPMSKGKKWKVIY